MIRRIGVTQLVPGMYVSDLHLDWLEHSLWRRRFLVRDGAVVGRLIEDGVTEVSIDTDRGIDVPAAVPMEAQALGFPGEAIRRPTAEPDGEREQADRLLQAAAVTVRDLMDQARRREKLDADKLEPLVTGMIESIRRHPDMLPTLARFRRTGSYAADHAVATTALMVALADSRCPQGADIERLAFGTLIKDIGQVFLDGRLATRTGKYSPDERKTMQAHVERGVTFLKRSMRLSDEAVAVVLEHHERFDGSGYPCARSGADISLSGRLAAIVDSYDAMTADRPYRRALSPATALRRVYRAGGTLFDPELAAGFVRTVGIYPTGSLVRLESGHLAVVEEIHRDNLLRPVVRVIFHTGRRHYVRPTRVDLADCQGKGFGAIVGTEEFAAWGINPRRWQPGGSASGLA